MNLRYMMLMFTGLSSLRFLSMCPASTFRDVNGNCIDCPPGFTNPNCSSTCPDGTYGGGCKQRCTCAECDPVSGCLSSSTDAVLETMSVTSTDVSPAEEPIHTVISFVILIVILAIVGFNFAVSIILLWRSSTNYTQQRQDKKQKESRTQETIEEIEMRAEGYESPIIPTERLEMRVYTELS